MDLKKYLPKNFEGFRIYQEQAVSDVIHYIEDNDVKTVILDAPTGFGKSLVAYISYKRLNDICGFNAYIYTKAKQLQSQYIKEFPDLCKVEGRSNYNCLESPFQRTCDVGECRRDKDFKCPRKIDIQNSGDIPSYNACKYLAAKWIGIHNPCTVLNYDYAMFEFKYANQMPFRDFGIFDEAHNIDDCLMSFLGEEITDYNIKVDLKDYNVHFPDYEDIEEWIGFIEDCSKYYKQLSVAKKESDIKKAEKFEKRARNLKSTAEFIKKDKDNWVFHRGKRNNTEYVIFKPIDIQDYTYLIFDNVEYKLLMSGSIPKADVYCEELGINPDEVEYIPIPSIIPPNRRPIIRDYVGSMGQNNIDSTFPLLIDKIKEIALKHKNEKGLIHTHNYNINNMLYNVFRNDDRFIFHSKDDREEKIEFFKNSSEHCIFVSPYCFEGVDFKCDEARFQIICKAPFPYMGDPQVKRKMSDDASKNITDWGWYHRKTSLKLSQAYGRTNRSPKDYSVTYLLDSDINNLLGPASLVTDYFLEAIVDYNYDTELRAVDASRLRSRGDNRTNQLIIFNDIKDGYNSLNKLRRAYKQLKGGSFTMVKPAVDYMLSCGAIRYVEE